jgi:molybdopterin/thiamine biosynthesis adenylyltransferase
MFLTIHESLIASLNSISADSMTTGPLTGLILDGGDVYQIQGLAASSGQPVIGRWLVTTELEVQTQTGSESELLLLFNPTNNNIRPLLRSHDEWVVIPYDIIRLQADYTSRIRGLFEVDTLAKRCVTVIGLGTGGGLIALELAKAGVGRMRLVDFDRLETHNIARHVCGLGDIGRYKTRAVRDMLFETSPLITVETWEANILEQPEVLAEVVRECDLVVAATDSERSKSVINTVCWEAKVPTVYGAAYNRAFGGDVVLVIPDETPCYECFLSVAVDLFNTEPPDNLPTDLPYEDPQRLADIIAEPGLGMDVGMIALIHAKMALLTLLRGTSSQLAPLPTNWVLWGNRAEWVFQKPLESIFLDVPRRPNCPFCNRAEYIKQVLGMTEAEATNRAAEILAAIEQTPLPVSNREYPSQSE